MFKEVWILKINMVWLWYIIIFVCENIWSEASARWPKWLMLPTLDHEVQGSNLVGGGIQLMTVQCFIAQSLSSRYDLNNVERDVKNQIIIRCLKDSTLVGLHWVGV